MAVPIRKANSSVRKSANMLIMVIADAHGYGNLSQPREMVGRNHGRTYIFLPPIAKTFAAQRFEGRS